MPMSPEDFARFRVWATPAVRQLLVETRAATASDPRPILKARYDGRGIESEQLRTRLGIASLTAVEPGDFNALVDGTSY